MAIAPSPDTLWRCGRPATTVGSRLPRRRWRARHLTWQVSGKVCSTSSGWQPRTRSVEAQHRTPLGPPRLVSKMLRGNVKILTYKPHTNHKRSSVSSHTFAPTTICDLSHRVCGSPLTDLGHISSVTYVCHPLWFVCGHRKGILTSPLRLLLIFITIIINSKVLCFLIKHSTWFIFCKIVFIVVPI